MIITFFLIIILSACFIIYKLKSVNNKNLKQAKPDKIKENNLTEEEKILIKEYFYTLDKYLDGFFLRKYILSLISVRLSDIEKLKAKYIDINCREVSFPILYSDIFDKNSSLSKFLKLEYSEDLSQESSTLHSEKLIDQIKNNRIKKKHYYILNELKNYIDEDDHKNWDKLYALEPVAIVN